MSSQQRMIQSWRHVNNGIEARFTGQEHVVGETKNLTYCVSRSVVSNPLWPYVCPWNSLDKNTEVGKKKKEYWGGLSCPPPGDLPNPGIELGSPVLQADSLPSELPGKQRVVGMTKRWSQWTCEFAKDPLEFFLKQECKPANEWRSLKFFCAHSRNQKHRSLLESSEKFQLYSTSTDSHPSRLQRMKERQCRTQGGSREEPPG